MRPSNRGGDNYIVLALIHDIIEYNANTDDWRYVFQNIDREGTNRNILFEFLNNRFMVLVRERSDDFLVNFIVDEYPAYISFNKTEVQRVIDIQMFMYNDARYATLFVVEHSGEGKLYFYDIPYDGEPPVVAVWTIVSSQMNSLTIQHLEHHSNYSIQAMSVTHSKPQTTRHLFVFSDTRQVRIYQYMEENIDINLDVSDPLSTFYAASDSHNITAVHVFADSIRRPLSHDYDSLTCDNVQYQPAQSIYIVAAQQDLTQKTVQTYVHLVPEFSILTEETKESNNPVLRPQSFNCKPGQYIENNECTQALELAITADEPYQKTKIVKIKTGFMDVPDFGLLSAYNGSRINPPVLCEVLSTFAYTRSDRQQWKSECLEMISSIECDIDLFNGNAQDIVGSLTAFFYQYWKTQIFAVLETDQTFVYSQSLWLDDTFGNFKLDLTNTLSAPGRVLDIYVTLNGQHVFSSVVKKHHEVVATMRFLEICGILADTKNDTFLNPYNEICNQFPPRNFSISDFAVVGSSCPDNMLCPSFFKPITIRDFDPGSYISRAFGYRTCPSGSYCINGIRMECPMGLLCDSRSQPMPNVCSDDDRMYFINYLFFCINSLIEGLFSCYKRGLKNPVVAPYYGFLAKSAVSIQ
jgi:hypothetical protein